MDLFHAAEEVFFPNRVYLQSLAFHLPCPFTKHLLCDVAFFLDFIASFFAVGSGTSICCMYAMCLFSSSSLIFVEFSLNQSFCFLVGFPKQCRKKHA